MTFTDHINRLLLPIKNRIFSMICKALLIGIDDTTDIQVCKVSLLKDEEKGDVERIGQFGFTSIPPKGSEAVVIFANGDRSKGIMIAVDSSRHRLKLGESGASAIYNQSGECIKVLKGKIEIHANNVILADGNKKLITEDILTLLNSHIHLCASPGSPSGPALNGTLSNPFTTLLHATSKVTAE